MGLSPSATERPRNRQDRLRHLSRADRGAANRIEVVLHGGLDLCCDGADVVQVPPCHHIAHTKCLESWLAVKSEWCVLLLEKAGLTLLEQSCLSSTVACGVISEVLVETLCQQRNTGRAPN